MRSSLRWLSFAAALLAIAPFPPAGTWGQDKVAPAAPAPPPVPDAVHKQWEQRYGPQIDRIHRMHRMELHLMRLVTEPTKQQYEKIAAVTEPGIQAMIDKMVEEIAGGKGINIDPRPIADGIAKAVREFLSPEQAARYQKELDLRTTAHKRLVVANLIVMMDKALLLGPDQREKLGEILRDNWNDSWEQLQVLTDGGQDFLPMPDAKITPILSETQQAVWREIPKSNRAFGNIFSFAKAPAIEGEVWDDEPPKKLERPKEKKVGEKP